MTGAQFKARVYQILGLPATHPDVVTDVIADNYLACVDELTLLVKPVTMRRTVSRAVVANSQTIYLPSDHLQTIKVRMADSGGNYSDLELRTEEDQDIVAPDWQDGHTGQTITGYSYAGIVANTGSNSYGQRILKLSAVPTTSNSTGIKLRYWARGWDVITGSNSQYQIVEVPRGYQVGLAYGVCRLIALDPRINRDPAPYQAPWEEMKQRYLHFGPEHREYDYQATSYTGIAQSQASYWNNQ